MAQAKWCAEGVDLASKMSPLVQTSLIHGGITLQCKER